MTSERKRYERMLASDAVHNPLVYIGDGTYIRNLFEHVCSVDYRIQDVVGFNSILYNPAMQVQRPSNPFHGLRSLGKRLVFLA